MRRIPGLSTLCAIGLLAVHTPALAQSEFLNILDHIHLAVPDQPKAVEWYGRHFGGQTMAEGPDRLMLGQTRLIFQKNETPQPSAGSVLDHIGFSVADLDATMRQLAASGVKITAPARDVSGLFKLAFIEDPWGTRIEVVQDPQKLGLHHVHVRGPDPAAALAWYGDKFGGKTEKMKGQIDGIQYGDVWVLAQRGDAVPSAGHAIDHIGFRPVNLNETVVRLKAKGVKVTSEPRALTLPSGTTMHIAFIEGLDGVRIELVQR
jgi:catechol 2,3-dioxygenase-like lactoylglutathione lyase family enzyme